MFNIKNMDRKDRLKMAIEKGYKCDILTGDIFGPHGKKISTSFGDYTRFSIKVNNQLYRIFAHQFVWYFATGQVADFIDHINRDKKDNRLSNLRSVTQQQNQFNLPAKGYYYDKVNKKYAAGIKVDGVQKFLGRFSTESEARQAYLSAKKIYHII